MGIGRKIKLNKVEKTQKSTKKKLFIIYILFSLILSPIYSLTHLEAVFPSSYDHSTERFRWLFSLNFWMQSYTTAMWFYDIISF